MYSGNGYVLFHLAQKLIIKAVSTLQVEALIIYLAHLCAHTH